MKKKSIELTIGDMHCPSCAITIEHAVKLLPGVFEVKVSYAADQLLVVFDKFIG